MAYINRRTLLERLGLGAGAFVLSPMVRTMLAEAAGSASVANRKRLIVFTYSNGTYWSNFIPPEHREKKFGNTLLSTQEFTMPDRFKPLAAYRNRMLLVDGLVNQNKNFGHFAGDGLSCVPNASKGESEYGKPGGQTFDQYAAAKIGAGTAFPSIHLSASTAGRNAKLSYGLFAKSAAQQVPALNSAPDAFRAVFPTGLPNGDTKPTGPSPEVLLKKKLLDQISGDVQKVRTSLAGTEKAKLDEYLSSIEEAQKRIDALQGATGTAGCGGKMGPLPDSSGPTASQPDVMEILDAQVTTGMAAIACGLTNVLTISVMGIGRGFKPLFGNTFRDYGLDLHGLGHGGYDGHPTADKIITFYGSQMARVLDRLSAIREGNGTIYDNSALVFLSDNAEAHHSRSWRYPVAVFGNAGGGLKADGRYIRYPTRAEKEERPKVGPAGMRPLADFWSAMGHAFGAPLDDFGKGGMEEIKGPLGELLP